MVEQLQERFQAAAELPAEADADELTFALSGGSPAIGAVAVYWLSRQPATCPCRLDKRSVAFNQPLYPALLPIA